MKVYMKIYVNLSMGVRILGKIKLYELAKEMDVSSKELLEQAKLLGMDIKRCRNLKRKI